MELDERGAAGLAGADVVRLDGAGRLGRNGGADLRKQPGLGRLVHKPAGGIAQHRVAGPEDVDRDQRRDRRIEPEPAGQRHQRKADQHAARRPDIRHHMLAAGNQGGGPPCAAFADQEQRPDEVDARRQPVDRHAFEGGRRRLRVEPAEIRLAENGHRCDQHQGAFDRRGEVFGFAMTVRMAGVGRAGADREGDDRGTGRDHVDDALERIREQRHATGQPPGAEFQCEDQGADRQTPPTRLLCLGSWC